MQGEVGMPAQTIRADRIRGHKDRTRPHRFEAPSATSRTEHAWTLFGRTLGAVARQTRTEQVATPARS
jgi:hypothetical protein